MSALAFASVTKKYGAVTALDRASLAIDRGEMFGLIGPDGAGKTTAIRVACGLVPVDGGTVTVLGRDPLREHRAVTERVRAWWPQVREALRGLRASNKLALLIGGSLATEILFATALGIFANALGYDVGLADLLVINITVSLLASFVPVPGGIGIAEFGLTVGLVAAGVPDEAALATAVLYRLATFYVPPAWGFFAMRWLQRNRYL